MKARFLKGLAMLNHLPEFENVVKLYEPLIKKFLSKYHLVYDYEEYQQIARIALWEAYHRYNPEKGSFPSFASATVRGRLLTEIKKRKRYDDVHEMTDCIQDFSYSEKQDECQLLKREWNFSLLSKREKEWVEAAIFQDLSTKEIALYYNVTQDTVRSWKKGAIKKLKQQYDRM